MSAPDAVPLILSGGGARARAWAEVLGASPRVRLVATVGRGEAPAALADLERFPSLGPALERHPTARVASALPPRAGLHDALLLAAASRRSVVEAPLHAGLDRAVLGAGAAEVRVAFGWCTLAGLGAMSRELAAARRARLEVRGMPETDAEDVDEALAHGLAVALFLVPSLSIGSARRRDDGDVELALGNGRLELSIRARLGAPSLRLELERPGGLLRWSADAHVERLEDGRAPLRERQVVPAVVRAVSLVSATSGPDLRLAQLVARAMREVERQAGRGTVARSLRSAAHRAEVRPHALAEALGLSGVIEPGPPPPTLEAVELREPLELWSFRAGHKPVAFLTVAPGDVERALEGFGGAHVVRRERRVEVGAQDAWVDRRDRGEPRVELYVSADRALAERAATLQAEGDPSGSVVELGALMGYPRCCVEAFARRRDRSNNTANRYQSAAASRASRWPWALSNLHLVLLPWYPCAYDCEVSRERAEAAIFALEAAHPGARELLRRTLARPVLYFTHEHQIVLDGEVDGNVARYRAAHVPAGATLGALGGLVARGDELVLDDELLRVRSAGRDLAVLARTDPGLGFLAPFR